MLCVQVSVHLCATAMLCIFSASVDGTEVSSHAVIFLKSATLPFKYMFLWLFEPAPYLKLFLWDYVVACTGCYKAKVDLFWLKKLLHVLHAESFHNLYCKVNLIFLICNSSGRVFTAFLSLDHCFIRMYYYSKS